MSRVDDMKEKMKRKSRKRPVDALMDEMEQSTINNSNIDSEIDSNKNSNIDIDNNINNDSNINIKNDSDINTDNNSNINNNIDSNTDNDSSDAIDDLFEKKDEPIFRGFYLDKDVVKVLDKVSKRGSKGIKSQLVNEALRKIFIEKGWLK
ncbi:hypothetical protein [Desertibacillus haloalkaliphilus]|uniref:hypothetical protein n=1 Tax=Desertibacillus haloalkaliphilus TaxID=1328930 RepID=UPI001C26F529|nr:hypothetical protein [Desertibacillus haloalkaliphilus]MBU8908244.1 hypothetical protein [Desertibacillus haloalkaliphilus]